MHEIKCPHCGKAFQVDETGYADLLKLVRDADFDEQLHARLELAEKDKVAAIELATTKLASELQNAAATKDAEIQALRSRLDAEEIQRKLVLSEALSAIEKERDALANQLAQAKRDTDAAAQLAEARLVGELQRVAAAKEAEIQSLKAKCVFRFNVTGDTGIVTAVPAKVTRGVPAT